MKRSLIGAAAVLFCAAWVPHEFYASILTVHHSTKDHALKITCQLTAHDVEDVWEPAIELKLGSAKEYPKADSLLNAYFRKHLALMVADRQLTWHWVGKELEGENLYCYLQVDAVDGLEGLTVSDDLLQEVFPKQQNIVHVEAEGKPTLSHTFIKGSGPYTFGWK